MAESLVGKLLKDRYRIDEFLGRGGMAEVYKVWDRDRSTYLALKLLRKDLARDVVFLRRFRREAQNLAQLQHPNIVRFYGLEQEELKAFMLMDYVEGEDLKTEIFLHRGEGMPPERALQLIQPVCSALTYAHKRGFIHCDVKPGNVMLHENGTVLLADFGIARLTDAATATMVGAGTPAYMAPEQVKGLDPVPQTDIYALGVVLYEMLTRGERPFTGERSTTTGTMSAKVRWEQVNLKPPSPREYNPDLSPALEAVVMKCLEKDPADRYQTPLDLLNALERAVGLVTGEISEIEKAAPISDPSQQSELSKLKPSSLQLSTGESEDTNKLVPESAPSSSPVPKREARAQNWWGRYGGWAAAGGILVLGLSVLLFGWGESILMPGPETETPRPATTDIFAHTATKTLPPTSTLIATYTPEPPKTLTSTLTPTHTLGVGSTKISEKDGMSMVYIPAGEFLMGSEEGRSDERPVHEVFINAFWMDEHEVTFNQFTKFLNTQRQGLSIQRVQDPDLSSLLYIDNQFVGLVGFISPQITTNYDWLIHKVSQERFYPSEKVSNNPVFSVSWFGAHKYCQWAGKRLPTEAEWEKAALGYTADGSFPWGNQKPVCQPGAINGAQFEDCEGRTVPVKTFSSNSYGIYDMAGNVWEWTLDWYEENYYKESPGENPRGPSDGDYKILRGGAWNYDEFDLRVSSRAGRSPNTTSYGIGFRCVVSIP